MSRWRPLAFLAAVLAGVGLLAVSALQDTLVYYRTPAEVSHDPPAAGERLRLGGTVVPGTLEREDGTVQFWLTDGTDDTAIVSTAAPPQTFREGEGAVVEGVLSPDGVFLADRVMMRHSNEYRPVSEDASTVGAG